MKILAPVKRAMDYNVKVRVKPDGTGVDTADVKMGMNPLDETTIEEAVRLKEKGVATGVAAISCGVAQCQKTLHTAMVIGADCGILVKTDAELQPSAVARLLKVLTDRGRPTLILLDKQAIDDDANQTGQMFAALAGLPQAACASKIDVTGDKVTVTCKIGGSLETVSPTLSVVITTDLCLNGPYYVTLPNIMKAKKRPFDIIWPEDLGASVVSCSKTLKVSEPPKRSAGVTVADVAALMEKLKNEAKVI